MKTRPNGWLLFLIISMGCDSAPTSPLDPADRGDADTDTATPRQDAAEDATVDLGSPDMRGLDTGPRDGGALDAEGLDAGLDAVPDAGPDARPDAVPDADLRPDALRPEECPHWPMTPLPTANGRYELPERRRFEIFTGCDEGRTLVSVVRLALPRPMRVELLPEPRARVTYWLPCDRGGLDPEVGCRPPVPLALELEAGTHTFVIDAPATAVDIRLTEGPVTPACANERDDDGDGQVDLADDGCTDPLDTSELPPPRVPACANGIDDDQDGTTDWPEDLDCAARGWPFEACDVVPHRVLTAGPYGGSLDSTAVPPVPFRFPGSDVEVPTRFFLLDPDPATGEVTLESDHPHHPLAVWRGCSTADLLGTGASFNLHLPLIGGPLLVAMHERHGAAPATLTWRQGRSSGLGCGDGLDGDLDGRADLADFDCPSPFAVGEAGGGERRACANGLDDDGDGLVDWPMDPDCQGAGDFAEASACPGPRAVVGMGGGRFGYHPEIDRATGSCGQPGTADVLMHVHLDRPSWLLVEAGDAIVHIRGDCNLAESEIFCGVAAQPIGPLPAGDWYVFGEGVRGSPVRVVPAPACADGLDNDADGLIDVADAGCHDELDAEEGAEPAAPTPCMDGIDNDQDGLVDWPADPECRALGDLREHPLCPGLTDFEFERSGLHGPVLAGIEPQPMVCDPRFLGRPIVVPVTLARGELLQMQDTFGQRLMPYLSAREACDSPPEVCPGDFFGVSEGQWLVFLEGRADQTTLSFEPLITQGRFPACLDQVDNDGDGRVDDADPGCSHRGDASEVDSHLPDCANGQDDDGDDRVDYPADPECARASDPEEQGPCAAGRAPDGPPIVAPGGWRYPFANGDDTPVHLDCGDRDRFRMRPVVVQVDVPSRLTARTHHSDSDPILSLRRGCDVALGAQALACDDDGGSFDEAEITADLEAPGEYVIQVGFDGIDGRVGTALEVVLAPLP